MLKHPVKSSSDFRSRTNASPPAEASPSRDQAFGGGGLTACHRCRATFRTRQLRLHNARPASTHQPRRKSKCDAFRKGMTPMAPPSHVRRGPGFHPWMIVLEGKTTPSTGKAAPNRRRRRHSFRPRNPLARTSDQEGRPQANNNLRTTSSKTPKN